MLFSSITFLYYFLPITLLLYFVIPAKQGALHPYRMKNSLLLLASFLFYFVGEPKYCLLMLASIFVGFLGGICIERWKNKKSVTLFVGLQLSLLGVFKYTDFAITTWNDAFASNVSLLKLALPIGISFYSFQIISYLVDVYRTEVVAERNAIDFATYVSMFPQLIAGPIVRYESIQIEMKQREISMDNLSLGAMRFIVGLGKKVLLADNLSEAILRFDAMQEMSIWSYWLVAFMYMLQIYYDFSGYSDMAIGLGKMLGFHFPENFNYPFISKSITEFWRRWHMTLGGFLKDYIYIPLGGSRCSMKKAVLNIMIVWFLSGLWHGASMNFVLWGLYFGLFLVLEKLFLKKCLDRLPNLLSHLYTVAVIAISFVVFRFDILEKAITFYQGMLKFTNISISAIEQYEYRNTMVLFVLAVLLATPLCSNLWKKMKTIIGNVYALTTLEFLFMLSVLITSTAFLIQSSVHPFLYFRF